MPTGGRRILTLPRFGSDAACYAVKVCAAWKLRSAGVMDVLSDHFILRGVSDAIRFDNGPELLGRAVVDRVEAVRTQTAHSFPDGAMENTRCESFNGKLRDELCDAEVFWSLAEAIIAIKSRRAH